MLCMWLCMAVCMYDVSYVDHFIYHIPFKILEALEVDYIDESEVLTPADDVHHIDKHDFKVTREIILHSCWDEMEWDGIR